MKTTTINKHKVTYYDAISELPVTRFHVYNKMMLIDAGIGCDLVDLDTHFERVNAFLASGKIEEAQREISNIRQNVNFIQESLSPRHLAFCALVKEIDGEETDINEDGLKRTMDKLKDGVVGDIETNLEESKKKIESELRVYFPNLFGDSAEKELFDLILKRTKRILKGVIDRETPKLDDLNIEILTYTKPRIFEGEKSDELSADRQFEKICLTLTEFLHCEPKKFSVLEFYSAFDYLKDKQKKKKHTFV